MSKARSSRSRKAPGMIQGRRTPGAGSAFQSPADISARATRATSTNPLTRHQTKDVERVQCPECLKMVPVRKSDGKISGHNNAQGISCKGAVPTQSISNLCEHGESPRDQGYNCDCPVRYRRK